MTISEKDKRLLFQLSGNRCSFPNCGKELTYIDDQSNAYSALSEIAHIVASSKDGPRGTYPLPEDDRDKYDNLMLLCAEHHKLVDDNPEAFPVEKLRRWKKEHEDRIRKATQDIGEVDDDLDRFIQETLYSTLLPVTELPLYVFSAVSKFDQTRLEEAKQAIKFPSTGEMTPFIIREGRIFCFQDLHVADNPFIELIADSSTVTRHHARDWWLVPDNSRRYVDLLNRCLNKLTGRKGIGWDKEHRRFYFKPEVVGQTRTVSYRPLNQNRSIRKVVWQPITQKTGLPKPFWFHTAAGLRFHQVSKSQWCLSIRPEMHITQDGTSPYPSKKKGSRITRRKSRMFNYELLGELQFWRDFLSDGKPRIVFPLGSQRIIVSSNFLQADVRWPGMPPEFAKPFENAEYVDDLFSLLELYHLSEVPEFGDDDWEDMESGAEDADWDE